MTRTEWMKGLICAERLFESTRSIDLLNANLMGYLHCNRNDKGEVLTDDYVNGFQSGIEHFSTNFCV